MNVDQAIGKRYLEESEHWHTFLADPERRRLAESWFRDDTVDAWRHRRMYSAIDPLLQAYPDAEWLTVGDGRFGNDAHYIQEKKHRVMATDIADNLLKIAFEKGYIRQFKVENVESLSFKDGSFDFVLCKECYHHLPRPILAVYEMLRIAKKGVVLIEPSEAAVLESPKFIIKRLIKWVLLRCGGASMLKTRDTSLVSAYSNNWEEGGNFVYYISEREIEKVAIGIGCHSCAFKGLNDYYEKGVEFEKATDDSLLFQKVKKRIDRSDRLCRSGLHSNAYGMLVAVIFKQPVPPNVTEMLRKSGFEYKLTFGNPNSAH